MTDAGADLVGSRLALVKLCEEVEEVEASEAFRREEGFLLSLQAHPRAERRVGRPRDWHPTVAVPTVKISEFQILPLPE